MTQIRWNTVELTNKADHSPAQSALFDDVIERQVGKGEYRGLEFLHVEARTVREPRSQPGPIPLRVHDQRVSGVQPCLLLSVSLDQRTSTSA